MNRVCGLAGQNLEDQKIGRMEARHRNVVQVFIGLRDVAANQDAELLHR